MPQTQVRCRLRVVLPFDLKSKPIFDREHHPRLRAPRPAGPSLGGVGVISARPLICPTISNVPRIVADQGKWVGQEERRLLDEIGAGVERGLVGVVVGSGVDTSIRAGRNKAKRLESLLSRTD